MTRRLSKAGFKKQFLESAILPDWWEASCEDDPGLLQEIDLRVARFLELPLATVSDPSLDIAKPVFPGAKLRRVRDMSRDRLAPAIYAATRIAEAVVRNLRNKDIGPCNPPADGVNWRTELDRDTSAVTLTHIVQDLWQRSIPVVPVDGLPTPSFQGMSCLVDGRPVILLGHKHDEPGRAAFVVAHEVGHVVAGDCGPGQPVVDEDEEIKDDADLEVQADEYAVSVLVGAQAVPEINGANFKEIARRASEIERAQGTDASILIFAWACRTRDYATATLAVRALYRHVGARRVLRDFFDRHVDVSAAGETDQALLRCVTGDSELVEAAG